MLPLPQTPVSRCSWTRPVLSLARYRDYSYMFRVLTKQYYVDAMRAEAFDPVR